MSTRKPLLGNPKSRLRSPPAAILEFLSATAGTRLVAADLRHFALDRQRERHIVGSSRSARGRCLPGLIAVCLGSQEVRRQVGKELLEGHQIRGRAEKIV